MSVWQLRSLLSTWGFGKTTEQMAFSGIAVISLHLKRNKSLFYHISRCSFGEFIEKLFHNFRPGKLSLFYQNVSNIVNE